MSVQILGPFQLRKKNVFCRIMVHSVNRSHEALVVPSAIVTFALVQGKCKSDCPVYDTHICAHMSLCV